MVNFAPAMYKLGKNLKKGVLTEENMGTASNLLFDRELAKKHLATGDLDIFKKILAEAKNKYALAKDNYYLGILNKTEYIWERGLRVGRGISWYDYRMKDLKLSTELLPTADREHFSWKSLKIEREIMPDTLIDPNNIHDCPEENEEAAKATLPVLFEVFDYYNENYIPTLAGIDPIRDPAWIDILIEKEAFDLPYSTVTVNRAEKRQFEEWRDGQI